MNRTDMPSQHSRSASRIVIRIIATTAFLGLGACAGDEASFAYGRELLQQWHNPGDACIFPEDPEGADIDPMALFVDLDASNVPEVTFDTGARATVRVYAPKPCSVDVEFRCTTKLLPQPSPDAGSPTVLITAVMDGYDDGTTECPRDIVFVSADCATPPLPEDFYDFKYGEDSGFMDIPSVDLVPCTNDASQRFSLDRGELDLGL